MNIRNMFVYVLICLFVKPLCAMKEISFKSTVEVESINFVQNNDIVVSVLDRVYTYSKKRQYILCHGEHMQDHTILYEGESVAEDFKNNNYAINNQGTKMAFIEGQSLTVYDIENKKKYWDKEIQVYSLQLPMTFNPENDAEVVFYDNKQNSLNIHSQQNSDVMSLPVVSDSTDLCIFHPTKTEFIFNLNDVYYYHGNYQNKSLEKHDAMNFSKKASIYYQCYSDDGSIVAGMIGNFPARKIFLMPLDHRNWYKESTLQRNRPSTYYAMSLSHDNRVMFILGDKGFGYQFEGCHFYSYDIPTGALLCQYKLDDNQGPYNKYPTRRIAISPDGKMLGIALDKKCLLLPITPEIVWGKKMAELLQKMIVLRCFQFQHSDEYPSEIINLIIAQLLDVYYA